MIASDVQSFILLYNDTIQLNEGGAISIYLNFHLSSVCPPKTSSLNIACFMSFIIKLVMIKQLLE